MPSKPKSTARLGNVYFLRRVGSTLRSVTSDITKEELPAEIQHLLRKLERQERKRARSEKPDGSSGDAD